MVWVGDPPIPNTSTVSSGGISNGSPACEVKRYNSITMSPTKSPKIAAKTTYKGYGKKDEIKRKLSIQYSQ